ncbi:TPA: incFII family plasmid replication initiator RepA, partial [Escherichia coli]|nr:incFII family plasmid replication initiator RepA [Escherichia coli]
VGFTSRFDFAIHVAHARSRGLRRRMPPVLRRRAIDALLQGLCFHYDPLANRVQCSITTLAIECGLATESAAGKLSITRATRALTFLSELGLITYQTEYDPLIGCYIPTDITFTPALFAALDVSEDAVAAARRSRVEWENRQRKKQGLDTLGMDELIAKAWRFVRERFRSYQTELKSRGIKRARARRDANRERQDIVTLVKRQLTREIAEGRFRGSLEAVKREIDRRVKERMIMSRNNNYTRLATASP